MRDGGPHRLDAPRGTGRAVGDVLVAGVGMTRFGRHPERPLEDLAREALAAALADAGCAAADVQAAFYSGVTNGQLQGQFAIPGQVVLGKLGIEGVPVFNVENACASGSSAFHLAAQSVRAGACDVALALGAEKMHVPDKAKTFAVFEGGWDVGRVEQNKHMLLALGDGVAVPPGSESDKPYSLFMAIYAAICRYHMKRFGTTQRQLAAVAAKNHRHSVENPLAQFRQPFTIEEVLAAPPITYPLTLPMCSPISDGAAAAIVCNAAGLARLGADRARAVRVAATVIRSATSRPADALERSGAHLAALAAYEAAGLGPEDMDVAEVHDATAMGEIVEAEHLGLAGYGEAGAAAERGDFTVGGRMPINPSGGLECKGHPIGATGLGQIHELVTQLRGEAGRRQVAGARHAIQENGGGLVGVEEAAVAVNIFARTS